MFSAEGLQLREARYRDGIHGPTLATAGFPPLVPRTAGGMSGRPRCRIFPAGGPWVLQVEAASDWRRCNGPDEPPMRLKFPTLVAAVSYAEQHGYDYRIITLGPVVHIARRGHRISSCRGRPVR